MKTISETLHGDRTGIIDRFEENFAIIETESGLFQLPVTLLPKSAKEGDVIAQDDNGKWHIRQTETNERRKKLSNLMDSLFD